MITINVTGGIGNQMFMYALAMKFRSLGVDILIDNRGLENYLKDHDYEDITKIFYPSLSSFQTIKKTNNKIIDIVKYKFFIYSTKLLNHYFVENIDGNFENKILELKSGYLLGYWQSYKYFQDISDIIKKSFKFPENINSENQIVLNKIKSQECSVSLHIRRGDYLKYSEVFGGICTEQYYKNAIDYMENKYPNCTFFIFTNDTEYAKKIFQGEKFFVINCNGPKDAWKDMYLMTQCDHNIIANSTFSWWGAYLNNNEQKTVISPQKFLNIKTCKDFFPQEWVRISNCYERDYVK